MIVEVPGHDLQVGDFLIDDTAGHVIELLMTDEALVHVRAEEVGILNIGRDDPVLVERDSHEVCKLSWGDRREVSKTFRSGDATAE